MHPDKPPAAVVKQLTTESKTSTLTVKSRRAPVSAVMDIINVAEIHLHCNWSWHQTQSVHTWWMHQTAYEAGIMCSSTSATQCECKPGAGWTQTLTRILSSVLPFLVSSFMPHTNLIDDLSIIFLMLSVDENHDTETHSIKLDRHSQIGSTLSLFESSKNCIFHETTNFTASHKNAITTNYFPNHIF